MDGIIIVNKPSFWTSFDVVAKIRNLSGVRRVGHSGTLDPMATGVLPVFLGKATRFVKYFLDGDKGYMGEMILGVKTDTGDVTGKRISDYQSIRTRVSENQNIRISREEVEKVFKKYLGEIEQVPPMYSAVKIKGKRLYELARKGMEVERKPRKVSIYELRWTMNDGRISFYVLCSKGTYIRQLVTNIGDDLGCGACLASLTRTYSHPFHISQALPLETIVTLAKIGKLSSVLISPEEILEELKKVR